MHIAWREGAHGISVAAPNELPSLDAIQLAPALTNPHFVIRIGLVVIAATRR